jgi:hypothetical protein
MAALPFVGCVVYPVRLARRAVGARQAELVPDQNRFERSYTLLRAAGQRGPEAIRKMILKLVST